MAVYGPDDVGFVLFGGHSLVGDLIEMRDKIEALTDTAHALSDTWHEHAALGLKRAEVSMSGYYNDAGADVVMNGNMGTARVLCWNVEGNTVGKKFIGYNGAMQFDYERLASLEQLHRMNVALRGSGQVDEGRILHALGARTSDGNSEGADSVDNGASSAGGGVAYLQVIAYSGFDQVVFKVRHSADDSSYADLVTFATVTAIGAERATTAVTVNRHLAVDWNVTGTGSVTFMVGFKRNA